MALSASSLADDLAPVLKEAHIACGAADNATLDTFCDALATAIAEAVVNHIKDNAVVKPTLLVWPGGMAPAPVTGTGTIE